MALTAQPSLSRCFFDFDPFGCTLRRQENGRYYVRTAHPNQNHLLAALPAEIFERISPHPELISMPLGEVLYEFDRLLCDVRNRQELPSASHG